MSYKVRAYRRWVSSDGLVHFTVTEKETDLAIRAVSNLSAQARQSVLSARAGLEAYIAAHPGFSAALNPVALDTAAPPVVQHMASAAAAAGVGPMAAVAGAIAEYVGRDLAPFSDEIIVENGGDIFMCTHTPRTIGIYAGDHSPFTGTLALEIAPYPEGVGICTSSGTVSHSVSFGKADAALIIARSAALADAAATAVGNSTTSTAALEAGIARGRAIEGVQGVLIVLGNKIASWGAIKIV